MYVIYLKGKIIEIDIFCTLVHCPNEGASDGEGRQDEPRKPG